MNPRQQSDDKAKFGLIGHSAAYVRRALGTELRPAWVGYVVAALLNAILTLMLLEAEAFLPLSRFPIFYTLATAGVAYWFGLFPAMFAFILSSAIFLALFIHTEGPWWHLTTDAAGAAGIVAFLVGTLVGGFGGLMVRRSKMRIEHLAEELASSNERMTRILESITDAFLALDSEWRFTYVNPEAGRLLERGPNELLERVIWDTLPEMADTVFYREAHAAAEQHVTVAFQEFYPQINKWLEIRAYPSVEGLAVYFQDVTERRRVEEAIRLAEQHRIEFYRRTLLAATSGKLEVTDRAEIEAIAGPSVAEWGIAHSANLRGIRQHVTERAQAEGISEERISRFAMCVGEATTNALKHASGGTASLHRLPDSLMLVVTDQGGGIEELNLPDVALTFGFSTAGTLGMGYKVMMSFADKMYLATGDDGTTVAVEMKLQPVDESRCVPKMDRTTFEVEPEKC